MLKAFPFKGGTRVWSNRYHFTGGTPANSTAWNTLFDNVTSAEKAIHAATTTITEAIGYAAGSEVPVASKTYALTGTVSAAAAGAQAPGEVVGLVRYSTNARTTKNHPIYCFNYYHGTFHNGASATVLDNLDANVKAAYELYAGKWLTGFSDGTLTLVRSTPQSATCTGQVTESHVTHRDFPPSPSL